MKNRIKLELPISYVTNIEDVEQGDSMGVDSELECEELITTFYIDPRTTISTNSGDGKGKYCVLFLGEVSHEINLGEDVLKYLIEDELNKINK